MADLGERACAYRVAMKCLNKSLLAADLVHCTFLSR
jgi:hypothetical protein